MIDKTRQVVFKMGILKVILFLMSATTVLCIEYVPALLWSTQVTKESSPAIPALSRLSSNEFTDYLLKRTKIENPVILLFLEENLSMEDFSWKDLSGKGAFPMLSNVTRTAYDVAFIPSIHDPYKALKKLKNHGYVWKFFKNKDFETLKDGKKIIFEVKLDEPDYLLDRPDMLKKHDEKMAEIYNQALSHKSNVIIIYTGSHTSWIDADLGRFKREEKDTNVTNTLIISDINNVIKMATTPPIVFKKKASDKNDTVVNITKVIGIPTIQETKEELILRVRFPLNNQEEALVNFKFTSDTDEWWTLNSADIPEMKETSLKPSVEIGAPSNFSYFCNPEIIFTNKNISFTFENFQVQPRVGKGNSFGPIIHCIPFFSIAILSGIVVVIILSVVLTWGIIMIMDINTNDRFDDPKGKTITITATD